MIKELEKIEFHDMPLKSLKIDFERDSIQLIANSYNETSQEYDNLLITFFDIKSFTISEIDELSIECINHVIIEHTKEKQKVNFEFLGKNCVQIFLSFEFIHVEITTEFSSIPPIIQPK